MIFDLIFHSQSSVGFSPTVEENCELSDQNSHDLDIENPSYYDNSERYDFYQREARLARAEAGCVDGEFKSCLTRNLQGRQKLQLQE